jgi:hypothetical protein
MKRVWSALALLFLTLILAGCGSALGREQIAPTAPSLGLVGLEPP